MRLIISALILLAGLGYLLYLYLIFPGLVPFHGSGERFTLVESENFTAEMPWYANTRLHLNMQTNDTVKLYVDGVHICDYISYDLVIEPDEQILVSLTSERPGSGYFIDWQEIAFENQLIALIIVAVGFLSIGVTVANNR
ncbi:MAG: hypothetical protein IAX21_10405 [Candidatus Bathyarchaeota archaeon]|nr:MAG: hypothetical protein IAX21_10405 [Candidatus Bathyarchaeota archaeon]